MKLFSLHRRYSTSTSTTYRICRHTEGCSNIRHSESHQLWNKSPLMAAKLTPLKDLTILRHQIPAHGLTPNTSLSHKPLLIYRSAFPSSPALTPSLIESHLSSVGVVTPQWRYTMYSTSHFHSTSHEVLGISRGRARLCFGHEENGGRVVEVVGAGDVVVVPAGVAHRLLEDLEGGFEMVCCCVLTL